MINIGKNRGVTLIALVITIIVLLILASVTMSMILSENGLIGKAQNATEGWNRRQEEEEEQANNILASDKTIAKLVNNETIKVGDYVKYEPIIGTFNWDEIKDGNTYAAYSGSTDNTTLTTQASLNWRVLDITDNGQVRLISDAPTTGTVSLQSYNGYNNSVYLLDEVCRTLYSGSIGTAKSLKIEDIEKHLTYDYTQYANSNVDTGKYGGTKELTSATYRKYPSIFLQEKTGRVDGKIGKTYGLSEQTSLINQTAVNTAETSIGVTQTHWYKSMLASDFKDYSTNDNMYYKLFINNGSKYSVYWLASRCVDVEASDVSFRVRYAQNGNVSACILYYASGTWSGLPFRLRPVVTLMSNVQVTGGDAETGWIIQ